MSIQSVLGNAAARGQIVKVIGDRQFWKLVESTKKPGKLKQSPR